MGGSSPTRGRLQPHPREAPAPPAGGSADHVHLLADLRRALAVCDLVRSLKVATTPFIARRLGIDGFAWQAGYGALSLGDADLEAVGRYIRERPAHHAHGAAVAEWEPGGSICNLRNAEVTARGSAG